MVSRCKPRTICTSHAPFENGTLTISVLTVDLLQLRTVLSSCKMSNSNCFPSIKQCFVVVLGSVLALWTSNAASDAHV